MKKKGIAAKEEFVRALISVGVTGIDKPWEKMTMTEKARYARYLDHKRAKEVDVAKISDEGERTDFISHFPWAADRYDVNKLGDSSLSTVVCHVPSLLKRVDKNRFRKLEWSAILARQPQLARHCDFASLSASDWGLLLGEQPQFVDRLDTVRFTSADDWRSLLHGSPSLWRKCPFATFARGDQIMCAAYSMPLLKKLGPDTLSESEWSTLLRWVHGTKAGKWLAHELKRLSGHLVLPRNNNK